MHGMRSQLLVAVQPFDTITSNAIANLTLHLKANVLLGGLRTVLAHIREAQAPPVPPDVVHTGDGGQRTVAHVAQHLADTEAEGGADVVQLVVQPVRLDGVRKVRGCGMAHLDAQLTDGDAIAGLRHQHLGDDCLEHCLGG